MDNELYKNLPQTQEVWTEEDSRRLRAMESEYDPDFWEMDLTPEMKSRLDRLNLDKIN